MTMTPYLYIHMRVHARKDEKRIPRPKEQVFACSLHTRSNHLGCAKASHQIVYDAKTRSL